jgi:hypothetical protein
MPQKLRFDGLPAGSTTYYIDAVDGAVRFVASGDEVAVEVVFDPLGYVARGQATLAGEADGAPAGRTFVPMMRGLRALAVQLGLATEDAAAAAEFQSLVDLFAAAVEEHEAFVAASLAQRAELLAILQAEAEAQAAEAQAEAEADNAALAAAEAARRAEEAARLEQQRLEDEAAMQPQAEDPNEPDPVPRDPVTDNGGGGVSLNG